MSCISKLQLYLKHKKYMLTFADIADFLTPPTLLSYKELIKVNKFGFLNNISFVSTFHLKHRTQQVS